METKVCKDCGEEFPLNEENFRLLRQGVTKPIYDPYCKPCGKIRRLATDKKYKQTRKYRKKYKERYADDATRKLMRKNHLKNKYGLTIEDYDTMMEEQGGACKICGSPPNGKPLHVDHCHNEGHVRGLLCSNCNTGLGMFRDSVELMQNAIEYLNT